VLTVLVNRNASGDWHMPVAPVMLLVPVLDILWVHWRRYHAGIRSLRDLLSSTGKDHLPHRLMVRGLSKPACMGAVIFLSGLAALAACFLTTGMWVPAAMSLVGLFAFFWHIEENARVVIRAGDQVALYQLVGDSPVLQTASHTEESLA
jgi:hypothetical protein